MDEDEIKMMIARSKVNITNSLFTLVFELSVSYPVIEDMSVKLKIFMATWLGDEMGSNEICFQNQPVTNYTRHVSRTKFPTAGAKRTALIGL